MLFIIANEKKMQVYNQSRQNLISDYSSKFSQSDNNCKRNSHELTVERFSEFDLPGRFDLSNQFIYKRYFRQTLSADFNYFVRGWPLARYLIIRVIFLFFLVDVFSFQIIIFI